MSDGESTGSNMIWAVTLLIIVAVIVGTLYYSGILGGAKKTPDKIDINISAPK